MGRSGSIPRGGLAVKAVFLGTNGWYDTRTGNTICVLIRAADFDIVFDAGTGFYKLDRYIRAQDQKPVYLFLSHFHLDHVVGLHTMDKFRFARGLTISGPAGARSVLRTLLNAPFTAPLSSLPYPVTFYELPSDRKRIPFRLKANLLKHSTLTLGYRLEIDGKSVSYVPDTGYCRNAVVLSKGVDLLIAECAFKSGQSSRTWPHLNPETAARIAKEARAKRLALVHFDARLYRSQAERKISENAARKIFKNTFAARDDFQVKI